MTASLRLAIFTRYPEPGMAKTRMIPALGAEGAARLHRRLTEHVLRVAVATGIPCSVWTTGGDPKAFHAWLGDHVFVDQGSGDLGERMGRVMAGGPAMIVGSDIPGLTSEHLLAAAALMERHEMVIGPATDGGYWLVGMQRCNSELFAAMPWGTSAVLGETRARAAAHGIDLAEAATLGDLDEPEDLARWPEFTM